MKLYRLANTKEYSSFGEKYFSIDIWTKKEIIDIACIKINDVYKQKWGFNRCFVEEFDSKD